MSVAHVFGSTVESVPTNVPVACDSLTDVHDSENDVMASGHVDTATCSVVNPVLFVTLLSPELNTYHVNLRYCHCVPVAGVTGIASDSTHKGAIVTVLVHVTVLPVVTIAPQFHQLDVNHVVGPFTHDAIVILARCCPVDQVRPTFVVVSGINEVTPTASVGVGCPTPGIISGTFVDT